MKKGFTLIEMSIVLVIIGLIIGGVLLGRDLISAAAVRAQIAQIEKYNAAVNTFKGKYGYLPGDIPDPYASRFGFKARGTCLGITPCSGQGDGDGVIEGTFTAFGPGTGYSQTAGETVMLWADLSAAGLLDGGFNTATSDTPPVGGFNTIPVASLGQYFPKAKMGAGNYVYAWSGGYSTADRKNYWGVSDINETFGSYIVTSPGLTVQQAYNIDQKIDDGLPQTGVVTAIFLSIGPVWASGTSGGWGASVFGDYDADTWGPITPQTVNPLYATDNGATLDQTCYNNGHTLAPEHYSMEYNNGNGQNCALSFQFQ